MFSTRSKNALKILIYLTEENKGDFIPLKDIADKENISLKYIEQIMPTLVTNGFVLAKHGKQGGYKLNKDPSYINVWQILSIYENDLAPVSELSDNNVANLGKTLEMFKDFYRLEKNYFSSITIYDLSKKEYVLDFVI